MGDSFLKIDGIAGESLDAQHPGEIEVLSFAWGVVNEGGAGSGTGGGAGRPTFRDFEVTSAVSKASPRLMLACATGTHFRSAVLSVRKAGGASQDYLRVTLKDCVVSAYQSDTSEGGAPVDQVRSRVRQGDLLLPSAEGRWLAGVRRRGVALAGRLTDGGPAPNQRRWRPGPTVQRKTTVRLPLRRTRDWECQRTARESTWASTSRPAETSWSWSYPWSTRSTSCSMIGPSSRSGVT